MLFAETCRTIGLAARFVSGSRATNRKIRYEEGDRPETSERHLHAWAEIYLPGAGWRGYDPTQGPAVADQHIALVASPSPRYTTPIVGTLKQGIGAKSEMKYCLSIHSWN